ncbi:amino acid ABC transporter permease [Miniphocaeibacter massiliensis]|uniref:amino acid ABC transporter permease n=1 Tax=Miniphocaeibacter massiliensis TaxID=2041841 RepID=UPI000C1BF102|nr:amino acid ABC transporter permease [Miniphocaeibacter massiliensis]
MKAFDFQFIENIIPLMLKYSGVTLLLSALAIIFGLIIAFIISMVIYAKVPILSNIFKVYISFFRGTPLMAQLFCFYFGIIPLIQNIVEINSFQAAVIVLSVASSAYMAESLRGALEGVNIGQIEAAQSIGMNYIQMMVRIVIPQAFRIALPTLFSSFINIIKDTSLVFAIGVKEMMAIAQLEGASSYRYLEAFISVLLVYWGITSILGFIQKNIEKRVKLRTGGI